MRFRHELTAPGRIDVRIAYQPHSNRGTRVPITITTGDTHTVLETTVDMTKAASLPQGLHSVGIIEAPTGPIDVIIGTTKSGGVSHADAVQFVPVTP